MLARHYAGALQELLRRWAAVTVLGPRQCGKTTFIRHALPAWTYVDLEQTFLIRKLPPFFANIRKRLVRSPKVYFRDTGLLHWFLGAVAEPARKRREAVGRGDRSLPCVQSA